MFKEGWKLKPIFLMTGGPMTKDKTVYQLNSVTKTVPVFDISNDVTYLKRRGKEIFKNFREARNEIP
jgi:hypothetical protein